VITRTLENKVKAAYYHGGQDFYAGAPCDPTIPLTVYTDLTETEQEQITSAWSEGWTNECLLQALPDGSPA